MPWYAAVRSCQDRKKDHQLRYSNALFAFFTLIDARHDKNEQSDELPGKSSVNDLKN